MGSKLYRQYYDGVLEQMNLVMDNELDRIEQGAAWIAQAVKADLRVHVYGTGGHNFMAACEIWTRAGSLCNYNLWMPPGTPCFMSNPSTENVPGLAARVFDYYRPRPGEPLILININGINATTIDSALEARRRGIRAIGVSSRRFAENVEPDCPQRHPSGRNLCDLVDLHIDAYTPVGDMILTIEKAGRKTASSSTFPLTLILHLLNARAIEMLVDEGIVPDFLMSGNTKAGAAWSRTMRDKWIDRIKHM